MLDSAHYWIRFLFWGGVHTFLYSSVMVTVASLKQNTHGFKVW